MSRTKKKEARATVEDFLFRVNNRRLFIGIDSGASGAVGLVSGDVHCCFDIPAMKVKRGKKNKTVFILTEIVRLFSMLDEKFKPENVHVCLEEAQVGIPGKGNSAYNGFRVGCNYAMWPLFILSRGYSLEEIRPNIWKKAMGLQGKDKETSRYKAMRMFPKAELHLKRHHDRAEALLLAQYLRRVQRGK